MKRTATTPADVTTASTPLGDFVVIARDDEVLAAGFTTAEALLGFVAPPLRPTELVERPELGAITDALERYFAGDVDVLDAVPVDQQSGPFRERAWAELRRIPAGTSISYGELAKRADSPQAIRAAGQACARNAACLFVPCHRVVASTGHPHHYAYGLDRKTALLAHEARPR